MAAPVGRSRQLEEALEEQQEQQALPQLPQQHKKAAANRRKSMAVTEQVGGQAGAEGSSNEMVQQKQQQQACMHVCLLACSAQYQNSLLTARSFAQTASLGPRTLPPAPCGAGAAGFGGC
jgi:hypothetical protein